MGTNYLDNLIYKPLTPALRDSINLSFEKQLRELDTCNRNALVNAQITALKVARNIINSLPDGYPISMRK